MFVRGCVRWIQETVEYLRSKHLINLALLRITVCVTVCVKIRFLPWRPCASEKASETTEAPLRFAELLEKMKATGIEEAPEKQTAEAYIASQGCLLNFTLNLFVFSYVQALQLGTDARFYMLPTLRSPTSPIPCALCACST